MRRAMKVLADKFKATQEAKGLKWFGKKSPAAYHRWFLRRMISLRDQRNP